MFYNRKRRHSTLKYMTPIEYLRKYDEIGVVGEMYCHCGTARMEDKKIFLGGIAFSVKLSELEAGEELVIQPAHYQSDFCRIVMAAAYEAEN